MTCALCENEEISFSYLALSLCQQHRLKIFKALLYDFHRASMLGDLLKEIADKGARALDE
jgi:hypothetical protein